MQSQNGHMLIILEGSHISKWVTVLNTILYCIKSSYISRVGENYIHLVTADTVILLFPMVEKSSLSHQQL